MEDLHVSVAKIARQAMKTRSMSGCGQFVEQSTTGVDTGNEYMERLIESMASINTASSQISNITKVIEDIAFQTNILALNAAIEAARPAPRARALPLWPTRCAPLPQIGRGREAHRRADRASTENGGGGLAPDGADRAGSAEVKEKSLRRQGEHPWPSTCPPRSRPRPSSRSSRGWSRFPRCAGQRGHGGGKLRHKRECPPAAPLREESASSASGVGSGQRLRAAPARAGSRRGSGRRIGLRPVGALRKNIMLRSGARFLKQRKAFNLPCRCGIK